MQGSVEPVGHLRQIFPEGDIVAVTDDASLGSVAARSGLVYVPLEGASALPDGSNVVLFLSRHLISKKIRLLLRPHRVLVVPIASFDGSPEAARYTLRMTMLTNYVKASEMAAYWIDGLRSEAKSLVFGPLTPSAEHADATRLVCSLGPSLTVDAWPRAEIGVGDWVSVGSCCELSITKQPSSGDDVFSMDGTVRAAGVLAARDPRCTEEGAARVRRAERLRAKIADLGPISLTLKKNVLVEARAGDDDFTDDLLDVTNPAHGLQALELGIGTNLALLPKVDWRHNSQLNEGAGAMHIGFGEGITGAHMDFIIPESEHHFLP
ncbi:hypothetical protein [Streptomyces cyaneofuscatus]|uniref:Crocagin biosynthetic protein CgnE/B domain-containing protein n=1 Tax=Streptomyces cyaneofuscatus TaxID=66883 RepID=A0ABZ1EVX4_9ACTN|nr:hypothetical protein [Streptomyces cyaneofuscatus]WSB08290.1 hypothetical protein OG849_14005 [Streptomyces cyaneofuscatus]WSD48177.1 hypothetical protein OG857_21400 [Streptomyces cyaneofuscatus]WTA91550.1 hypothetical protein OG323_22375 [Streptomyces cyaneofuscatus]